MAGYRISARRIMRGAAVFLALTALSACGGSLSGTYRLKQNTNASTMLGGVPPAESQMSLSFNGSSVDVTAMGRTVRGTYAVSGKEVTISFDGQQSAKVFTIDDKGCLTGGPDETYCKS